MPAGLGIFFALTLAPAISVGISFIPKFGGPTPIYSPAADGFIGSGIMGVKASILSYAGKAPTKVPEVEAAAEKPVQEKTEA